MDDSDIYTCSFFFSIFLFSHLTFIYLLYRDMLMKFEKCKHKNEKKKN